MRLSFPGGEHAAVDIKSGQIAIGSVANGAKAVVLPGIAALHAQVAAGRRGCWLTVPAGISGVHLNGRPVKRLAFLRAGDLLCLGDIRLQLEGDPEPPLVRDVPKAGARPDESTFGSAKAVLRGLSGAWFGKTLPLATPRTIGSGKACDVRLDSPDLAEKHCSIEISGDQVLLRALSERSSARVNGYPVRDAILAPGDQLQIAEHRFLLEAPGFASRGGGDLPASSEVHTQTLAAVQMQAGKPLPPPAAVTVPERRPERDRSGLILLIAAAAALCAAMTALFVYGPLG